jgi:hypothetical protein
VANPHATNEESTGVPAPDGWAYDFIASTQVCPVCFAQVAKHHTRENRSIMLATYVCLFEVRWGLAQVTA